MPSPSRLASFLASPRLPWGIVALASLLSAPGLGVGLVVDDYVIRAVETAKVRGPGVIGPFDVFRFTDGSDVPRLMADGVLPWWTSPGLKLAFFRPLSSASHWLDFQLFPGSPAAMHVESLAWLVATVMVAAALYRRLLGAGWVAGLATVLFTLDPGHALTVGWVAGRNTILAAFFGLAAVYAHDRRRRGGARWGAVAAPLLVAASLASGESGLATLALLAAHALAFDGPRWAVRARALAPYGAVALIWAVIYRAHGSGAAHSALYIDPLAAPGDFVRAAVLGVPINLGARLGGAPASIATFFAARSMPVLAAAGLAFVLFAALALAPVARKEPAVRFFAVAAALAVLPIAGTIPNDRNLFLMGFAAFGLEALVVRRAVETRGLLLRLYAGWILLLDLGVALPAIPANAVSLDLFARLSRDPLSRVLLDDGVRGQTAVFVNPPAQFFMSHLGAMRAGTAAPAPAGMRALVPGIYRARFLRVRDDQLAVHVEGGMLPRPGTWPARAGEPPAIKLEYVAQHLSSFVRGVREPLHTGDVITLPGWQVEVGAVADGGSPVDVTFTFDRSLDDPSLRWLAWQGDGYVTFPVPAVGQAVELAPAVIKP